MTTGAATAGPAIAGDAEDRRFMDAALALARRAAGRSGPNPNVGCLLVAEGAVVGAGWTGDGGRPHAEAMALQAAGPRARGATAYVTLEPCAHESPRGPDCAGLLVLAGVARAVVALHDPDPRTAGRGLERLQAAGIAATVGVAADAARLELAGWLGRMTAGRPELTLKLALSLDGRLALADGSSRWITGEVARAFAHRLRAMADWVLVGGGTLAADAPRLDVRLPGHAGPQPRRVAATRGPVPEGWLAVPDLAQLDHMASAEAASRILCEGGARLAAALLAADRVDRLVLLRAPILLGAGPGLEGLGVGSLAEAHGRWTLEDRRPLGADLLEVYRRSAPAADRPAPR